MDETEIGRTGQVDQTDQTDHGARHPGFLWLADEVTRAAQRLNLEIGKGLGEITIDDARTIQRRIREAEAWLHGAAKLLDTQALIGLPLPEEP